MKPALAACLCAAALSGCADNEISVAIVRILAPQPPDCVADATSVISQSRGVLDLTLRGTQPYVAAPVVTNNLANRLQANTSQLDAVFVNGFDVELKPDVNDALLQAVIPADRRQFFYPAAVGRLEPGGTSFGTAFVEIVPAEVVQLIGAAMPAASSPGMPLIARIRPVATHAGSTLLGGWVPYPVSFCRDCLVDSKVCTGGTLPPDAVLDGGCFYGQDAPITCCDGTNVCGAAIPSTP
jgi:hypothetical protein